MDAYQPDETTAAGVHCDRALVGSTSLAGDLWIEGGFCPGATCPATIGDFEWSTTASLDLGALCGGMDLGDVPAARLRALDTIDLVAAPDLPDTNVITVGPGKFQAELTLVNGEPLSLGIANARPASVTLDSTTERVVFDVTLLQDLVVTRRELDVHLEAVVTNHRPVADAGADRAADCGEAVTLASASTDDEGPGDLVAYQWVAVHPDTGELLPRGTGPTITIRLFETTTFVLTVVDASRATDADSVTVTLPPFEPVSIDSVTLNPQCLWPPNHSYVAYSLGSDLVVSTSGGECGSRRPVVRIAGVTSDEPDDGLGDGSTSDDVVFDRSNLCVRSERSLRATGGCALVALLLLCAGAPVALRRRR